MRKIYNYIMIAVFAFAAISCIDEIGNTDIPTAETGDEVQFGLSLPDAKTRIVYGDEANNAFPIYWVNNDKVQIFSPQGLENRRSAEYQVSVTEANQNYADNLNKTGAYGVQWGEEYIITEDGEKKSNLHNFYSLYPSGNYTLSSDGSKAENITINYSQNIVVDGNSVKSDMEDCLMYAKAEGVVRGNTVNLKYAPISTVFMITLTVPSTSADDFLIQSISLTAPATTKIAGTFSLNIADGTFGGWGSRSESTVSAQLSDKTTGGLYTLVKGNSVEIPLFIAPVKDLNTTGWKISVVANNKTYSKTLGDQKIVAGKIHKVTLPSLSTAKVEEWDVADWMTNVPRNVYLSEVSIPGTWNSLNVDCQSNTSISDQYDLGVRAFHLDTRWRAENKPIVGETFTGITKPSITTLSVATGGSGNTYKYDGGNLMQPSFGSFADYLKDITDEVQPDEYMVVFCTFSQNSYNGDRCPSTWYKAVSDACAANDAVYDAKLLTDNTLVGDVLNRVIVVVNLESAVSSNDLPTDSKCLFTYIPMQLPETYYAESNSHEDVLYYGSKTASGISMYTSHAQISTVNTQAVDCGDRGYSHPLTSRDDLVDTIWDWSKSNYGTNNYKHDRWLYLGLGGYIMNSSSASGSGYDKIENRYAPKIYNRINEMGRNNNPYYPLGIILMNNKKGSKYTTSDGTELGYDFAEVCKHVLLLNNKYRLQYDPTKPAFPTTTPKSAAASYSSGMQDTGTSAFGWE